ncbi:class I SAM-dependent methyltransferase [Paludibacter sp.]|uniref:class I SAM-dependent DNA methyltransferase n=1 Tax=Paludibacter sp. TaxID=1898105 RepID=UPI001355DF6C|nr:class I SAM-dependent methyltransferase [Paludibacter sp.]MTK52603.1 class I SAM-dependent methyltransferase [Paludibacter sp.]
MAYNWDYLDKRAYNNRVGHYKFKCQFEFITRYGEGHFDKVLDIAGGSGRFALPLYEKQLSKDITMIDLNQEALQLAKERNPKLKTLCGNFEESELNDTFSLILCIEALGYFNDLKRYFSKVNLLLEKEGRFIFTYQNPQSWRFTLRKIRHWIKGDGYTYHDIELNDLKELLLQTGFEIEKMEGMNWMPFPLSSNSIFVPVFEWLEKLLHLKCWLSQSPWILFCVRQK